MKTSSVHYHQKEEFIWQNVLHNVKLSMWFIDLSCNIDKGYFNSIFLSNILLTWFISPRDFNCFLLANKCNQLPECQHSLCKTKMVLVILMDRKCQIYCKFVSPLRFWINTVYLILFACSCLASIIGREREENMAQRANTPIIDLFQEKIEKVFDV